MEFGLSEEQRMLQESVSGYLASACALPRVREAADAGDTKPGDVWEGLAQLGVQGIVTPEDYGGVGLSMLEAALAAESLGGAAAPAPFVASSVMAPVALMQAGSDAQREAWLPRIASGDAVIGVGLTEQIGRRDSDGIAAEAGRLTGRAMFVLDGMDADALIVADNGGALYLVHAADTDRRSLNTIDRTRSVAEVSFDSAPAEVLPGSASDREPMLAVDRGVVGDKCREEVALLDAVDLGHRPTRRLDDLPARRAHPQEAVEEPLPFQDLPWPGLQDMALLRSDVLDPFVAHLVKVQRLAREHERIHIPEVPEVLFG